MTSDTHAGSTDSSGSLSTMASTMRPGRQRTVVPRCSALLLMLMLTRALLFSLVILSIVLLLVQQMEILEGRGACGHLHLHQNSISASQRDARNLPPSFYPSSRISFAFEFLLTGEKPEPTHSALTPTNPTLRPRLLDGFVGS